MAAAIAAISSRSHSYRPKLNGEKSKVIWLGMQQQLLKLSARDKSLQLSDSQLCMAVTVRTLGVQIDEQMSFDSQSRSCAKACYYHLRHIQQITKYIDDESVKSLVHAFFASMPTPVCLLVRGFNVYKTVQHV